MRDISVLCSFGEGFSNTILESMYLKPVIASDVGGNIDLIGNTKKFGYLFPKSHTKNWQRKFFFER